MAACSYCGREAALPCMNTRDMEDRAVEQDNGICFRALAAAGGGEYGIERIAVQRKKRAAA